MQLRSEAATADMYARKAEGATIAEIATIYGMKPGAIYARIHRTYGPGMPRSRPVAANDNNPERSTRMAAHNGGCSTASGLMPVSVRRVVETEQDEVDEDVAAGLAVTAYALRHADMRVAA